LMAPMLKKKVRPLSLVAALVPSEDRINWIGTHRRLAADSFNRILMLMSGTLQ
jgi:hypothetical protein